MKLRHLILTLGFALIAMLGYWLAHTAAPGPQVKRAKSDSDAGPKRLQAANDVGPKFRTGERPAGFERDHEATDNGALAGQRILVFKDRAALEDFLKRAGDSVNILGRLDALNALRVGFGKYSDLAGLTDGSENESLVFPVDIPPSGSVGAQAGAVPLGAGLLKWLGITSDNSLWGDGVKVAVLDTGVTASKAFASLLSQINLVALPTNLSDQNGHGTAVASMIIGQNPLTPGVAPGAEVISIRIANDLGQSDSFLLAQGIVAAVDAGAQLINISLGSPGDSALVRNAIEYAKAAGALIVASAGNNGLDQVSYPAANQGVIAVGAVDAKGAHLDFSNTGTEIAVSAPGYGVNAAWTGDEAASVSGTSFSSPIIVGAIAALMSQPGSAGMTADQASDMLLSYLNDAGEAGADTSYGAGMPDLGRVLNANTPGIYDAAVASQRIIAGSSTHPGGEMELMIQNRGTETLINTSVEISTSAGTVRSNITTLAPNDVRTIRVPLPSASAGNVQFNSSVSLSTGYTDTKPSNDRGTILYAPVPAN